MSELARAGLDTLAVRQPGHPAALDLLKAFGAVLVAPSANPSGRISPTSAEHVANDLGDRLDLILDGGPSAVGVESTIVSLVGEEPALLRPGGLDPDEVAEALGRPLARHTDDPGAPTSPGQLLRHYAPEASLRLDAEGPREGETYLGFGPEGASGTASHSLSRKGDLAEAAANLFGCLRDLDSVAKAIAVAPIPDRGLGVAIRDRLERAAR
ncbi:MAG: L-threonylcarbamoyladenylate synthase [Planctomycetota bacterium]